MTYTFIAEDSTYTNYKFQKEGKNVSDISIVPHISKLFNNDCFITIPQFEIIKSPIRMMKEIPGVLILASNKTYGAYKDKLFYKCIPDDKTLPAFLVPYKIKSDFKKVKYNKYVLFKYKSWDKKHPEGILINTIGDVNNLPSFYEYDLYCKSLHISLNKFSKTLSLKMKGKSEKTLIESILSKNDHIKDYRSKNNIITIDPIGSKDLDDAISIDVISKSKCIINIYIANVTLVIEELEMWDVFTDITSTIYLPDRNRTMMPLKLSENLCSLLEKKERLGFVFELVIENNRIVNKSIFNAVFCVNRNYAYDSDDLNSYKDYFILLETIRNLNKEYNYLSSINDSHDLIAYLMITMNYCCAKKLLEKKKGIYRSVSINDVTSSKLPSDIEKFVKIWGSSGGKYSLYSNKINHDALKLDSYIHITSPIRRIVDLLNMIEIQINFHLFEFKKPAKDFLDKWIKKIDYINYSFKSIKKIQNRAILLNKCLIDSKIINSIYDGFVIDYEKKEKYNYCIYIPSLKIVSNFKTLEKLENYSKHSFKLYMFNDEYRFKKKIRLEKL